MRVLSLIWVLLSICPLVASAATKVVVVGEPDAAAWVEAELSASEQWIVLTRSELRRIFGEQTLTAGPGLGLLAGADVVAAVEGQRVVLSDALTADRLGEVARDDGFASALAELVANRSVPSGEGVAVHAANPRREAELIAWLAANGFRVLERRHALDAVLERELIETGFAGGRLPVFPGSDFSLVDKDGRLGLFGADGLLLAEAKWTAGPAPEELLAAASAQSLAESRQRIPPEALTPFYRGIALFSAGNFAAATAEFQRAYEASNRFRAAYAWEARCYDMLGLPGLAEAVRRFAAIGLTGRGVALGSDTTPREGITFLGLAAVQTGDAGFAARLNIESMGVLLPHGLLLPESLARAGQEYDLLARTSLTEGRRWETSAGFLSKHTLTGRLERTSAGQPRAVFHLFDSLGGDLLEETVIEGPEDLQVWPELLQDGLSTIGGSDTASAASIPSAPLPPNEDILQRLRSARSNADRNVALLELLLSDPSDPAVFQHSFKKGSDELDGLDNFLNYARRDYLLSKLPPEHPQRPWLELEHLQAFLPWPGNGTHLSGRTLDVFAELERFSAVGEGQVDHPARVAGRSFWLFDRQSALSPDELARETADLLHRMENCPELPRRENLLMLTRSFTHIARVAAGLENSTRRPPEFHVPERLRFEFGVDGKPRLHWSDITGLNRWALTMFTEEEWRTECEFSIAMQGRRDRLLRIEPDWMDRFPQCFGLTAAIAWGGLKAIAADEGRPWIHTLSEERGAEVMHWRRMVDFTYANLRYWLGRVRLPEEFARVESCVNYFLQRLNTRALREIVDDEEYARWHEEFRTATAAAVRRAGCPDKSTLRWDSNLHDWRTLTRAVSAKRLADDLCTGPQLFRDRSAPIQREQEAFARAQSDRSALRQWWGSTDGDIAEVLPHLELAALIESRLPALRATLANTPLSEDERAMILDCGIVQMMARNWSQAENLLRSAANAEASPDSDEILTRSLQAMATWHLARVLRISGQRAEAISALQESLALGQGRDIRYLWRVQPSYRDWIFRVPQGANIPALALRMLEEMRFDATQARLPDGVRALTIMTQQLNNPSLPVFYRLPQNIPARAVLVLVPSVNESVLPYLDANSSWARWAEQNGIVLMAPQFNGSDTHRRMNHATSAFQNAQAWAGEAVLQAVEAIAKSEGFPGDKVLLHGFGGGAQFVQSFARWKPERSAALSAHSASIWSWLEGVPGQEPLAKMAGIPMLFTVGELNDHRLGDANRRASTAQLVTRLRDAGCEVRFELLPGAAHLPTPEMESLAQSFLTNHL